MNDSAQGARVARKKAGRPPLSLVKKRGVPLRVWATYAEHDVISRKARDAGLPVAEFMRRAALGKVVEAVHVPEVNHDARRELTAIGHHLNRIVRSVEASGGALVPLDLSNVLAALRVQADALALSMLTGVPGPRSDFEAPLEVTSRGAGAL